MSDAPFHSSSRCGRTLKLYIVDGTTAQTCGDWRKRRIAEGGAA